MVKSIKVILFLLLIVTLHGIAGNVFTEEPVEQKENTITYSMRQHGVTILFSALTRIATQHIFAA